MKGQQSLMWAGITAGAMAVATFLLFGTPIGWAVVGSITGIVTAIFLHTTNSGIIPVLVPVILWLITAIVLFTVIWWRLKRR